MLWITRFQVGSAFQEYLHWQKQPFLQGYQSKGDGRSPHPSRGSYFISLLSWPGVTGWGEAGTPTLCSTKAKHVSLRTWKPRPGQSRELPRAGSCFQVPRNPAQRDSLDPQEKQQHQAPTERHDVCVFWFHTQLLLRQNNICHARDLWSNK